MVVTQRPGQCLRLGQLIYRNERILSAMQGQVMAGVILEDSKHQYKS